MGVHFPSIWGRTPLCIDRDNDTLRSETFGCFLYELGTLNSSRVDADFVSAGGDDGPYIFQRANAAAHGERDEDCLSHTAGYL